MALSGWIGTASAAGVLLMLANSAVAATNPDRTEDRRAISEGEAVWGASFATGNVADADRLLADDFSGTRSDGERYDKPTVLGWLRKGPNVASNATTVTRILFLGEVAIVQGHDAVMDLPPNRALHDQVWTDVWVRRDGAWRVVSAHDTRVNAAR